jgi:NADH:ubiquinone reductase (H+-translocating)
MDSKKILVLGGGFAGVRAALEIAKTLRKYQITLVSNSRSHCFIPDLYEVATAYLKSPQRSDFLNLIGTVDIKLEEIFKGSGVEILVDSVNKIDLTQKKVFVKEKGELGYDYLVVALGSVTEYFGVKGAENFSHPLKNTQDALNIRNDLDELITRAGHTDHKLQVVIAGGGFTGVELAGAMGKLLPSGKADLTIVEGMDKVLNGMPEWAQELALKKLQELGVNVKLNCKVTEVAENELIIENQDSIPFHYLIWTTGVRGINISEGIVGVEVNKRGRVEVKEDLSLEKFPEVFVVGDLGQLNDNEGKPVAPQTGWAAIEEGRLAAKNIFLRASGKPTQSYKPHPPAFIVPVGERYALSNAFGLKLAGFIAWFAKQFATIRYLNSIVGLPKALSIWEKDVEVDLLEH